MKAGCAIIVISFRTVLVDDRFITDYDNQVAHAQNAVPSVQLLPPPRSSILISPNLRRGACEFECC